MSTLSPKDEKRLAWVKPLGWKPERTKRHIMLRNGGHTITLSLTPGFSLDTHTKLIAKNIKQCERGTCNCHTTVPPLKPIPEKPVATTATQRKPKLANRQYVNGKVIARIVTWRQGKQVPYDLILTPEDGDVWHGHLLADKEPNRSVEVLADLGSGELHVGSLRLTGVPLHELRWSLPAAETVTAAEAAAILNFKSAANMPRLAKEGRIKMVKPGRPGKGGSALYDKASVLAEAARMGVKAKAVPQNGAVPPPAEPASNPEQVEPPAETPAPVERPARVIVDDASFAYKWGRLEGMVEWAAQSLGRKAMAEALEDVAGLLIEMGLL